ncbi:MAG: nitrate ABC transporter permease [Oscillospiraceae bacterium]
MLLWLVLWQLAAMALRRAYPHGNLLLASPVSVLERLWQLACTAAFWETVGRSAARIFGGFLLSTILAVLCAALAAWKPRFRELLAPPVAVIKAVPVASFIILALVWLDSRSLSFFISALMVFPPVYLNVLEGLCRTDRQLLEMARHSRPPLPAAAVHRLAAGAPHLRTALSLALGLCWKAGAAAEVIGLPAGTIGERLYTAKVYFQTPDLFAWTLAIVAVSVLAERLLLRLADAAVERWCG